MDLNKERKELAKLCRHFISLLEDGSDEEFIAYEIFRFLNTVCLVPKEDIEASVTIVCADDEEAKETYKVVNEILDEIRLETFDA